MISQPIIYALWEGEKKSNNFFNWAGNKLKRAFSCSLFYPKVHNEIITNQLPNFLITNGGVVD